MCGGGGGDQTVTQKTELDPAMRRLLYGGTAANPRGGFGSTGAAAAGNPGGNGGGNTGAMTYDEMFPSSGNTPVGDPLDATGIGSPDYGSQPAPSTGTPLTGSGGLYAMGGPVMPQQGLASLNQGQMPMMNGQMPNLSDPMTAATLAMAVRRPERCSMARLWASLCRVTLWVDTSRAPELGPVILFQLRFTRTGAQLETLRSRTVSSL